MTEPATPKLGQTSGHPFTAALGGYAAEVDLLSDEIPLQAWEVAYGRRVWENAWGILYLTTHRLVWIRSKIALPWVAKTLEIPLDSVIAAKARRRWWPIPFDRGLVVISREHAESCQFSPSWSSPGASEITREITSILRERGLLRG